MRGKGRVLERVAKKKHAKHNKRCEDDPTANDVFFWKVSAQTLKSRARNLRPARCFQARS